MLLDAKADLLVYGNAERQIIEIAHRLAGGAKISEINDLRGTSFVRKSHDFIEIDSTHVTRPGRSILRLIPMRWNRRFERPMRKMGTFLVS